MTQSILNQIKLGDIKLKPYPYVVKQDVLDQNLCNRLIAEFPPMETITKGKTYSSNERFSLPAADVTKADSVSPLWKEFIQRHVSPEFLSQFLNLFKSFILQEHPDFERDIGSFSNLRPGVRNIHSYNEADIVLDAQICLNTPVVGKPTSVKIAHLDSANELFAGLLYLRPDNDNSTGGELEVYSYKNKRPQFHGPRLIDDRFVTKVDRVPYKRNCLVLFINSFNALHGVTSRSITDHPRLFVNFLGEVKRPLFDLAPYREGFLNKILRRLYN